MGLRGMIFRAALCVGLVWLAFPHEAPSAFAEGGPVACQEDACDPLGAASVDLRGQVIGQLTLLKMELAEAQADAQNVRSRRVSIADEGGAAPERSRPDHSGGDQ